MGVVVADGAVELAGQRHRPDRRDRALEAGDDVGDLLAERRRRRRLAVRAREHRQRRRGRAPAPAARRRRWPSAGSSTSRRAAASISPCARLLMSSDVQAKWMNSATAAICGVPAKRSFSQYSTALTSWLVVRSIALIRAASAGANDAATASRSRARRLPETARPRGCPGPRTARSSHAISTRTRARISPNSLKCSASARDLAGVAAVERREREQRRGLGIGVVGDSSAGRPAGRIDANHFTLPHAPPPDPLPRCSRSSMLQSVPIGANAFVPAQLA